MFAWICPQCGREVPPSYGECPDCAAREAAPKEKEEEAASEQAPEKAVPPASADDYAQAVRSATAPQIEGAEPGTPPAAVKHAVQGWLVALLVAVILVGIGAAGYFYLPSTRAERETQGEIKQPPPLEKPPPAAPAPLPPASAHPMAKFIEATGVRLWEEKKQVMVRLIIVNHSSGTLSQLDGAILLRAVNAAPEAPPLASFPFKLSGLEANSSQELTTRIQTSLRAYELPDWQFLRAEVQLAGP